VFIIVRVDFYRVLSWDTDIEGSPERSKGAVPRRQACRSSTICPSGILFWAGSSGAALVGSVCL